ncbi:MAG TPA: type II toxin-antitoxin system HicB family antitoxin [Anaerolineae bacterium]|nr:type II toxin-antitoxin system HicB family antitoxin [Anaerolineae bacterium]HQH39308.1 type II toxin-antitoxin system HicB family antitoxin [Anaerolineae bacterium]
MSETVVVDEVIVPITVDYLEEDAIYKISCPALPGCHAWGETLDEAMRIIPANIRAMLEARESKGSVIPSLFASLQPHTHFVLRMVPA